MSEQRDSNLGQFSHEDILRIFQKATANDRKALLSDFLIQTLFDYQFSGQASLTALNLQPGFTLLKNAPSLRDIYFELSEDAIISPNKTSLWRNLQKESSKARHQEFEFSPAKAEFVGSVIPVEHKQSMLTCNTKYLVESFNTKMGVRVTMRLANCRQRLNQVNKILVQQISQSSPLHSDFIHLRDELRALVNLKKRNLFAPRYAQSVMLLCDQFLGELDELRLWVKANKQLTCVEALYAINFWCSVIDTTFLPFVRVVWLAEKRFDRFDQWMRIIGDFVDDHQSFKLRSQQDSRQFNDELISELDQLVFSKLASLPALSRTEIRGDRFNIGATTNNKHLVNFVVSLTKLKACMQVSQRQFMITPTLHDNESRTVHKARKTVVPTQNNPFSESEYDTVMALHDIILSVLVLGSVDLPDLKEIQVWDIEQCANQYPDTQASLVYFTSRIENYLLKLRQLTLTHFHADFKGVVYSVAHLLIAMQQHCEAVHHHSIRRMNQLVDGIAAKTQSCITKRIAKQKTIQNEIKAFCEPMAISVVSDKQQTMPTLLSCFDEAQAVLSEVELLVSHYSEQDDIRAELDEKLEQLTQIRNGWALALHAASQKWFEQMILCVAKPVQKMQDLQAQVSFIENLNFMREQVLTMLGERVHRLPGTIQSAYTQLMESLGELAISAQHYNKVIDNASAVLQGYQSEMQTALNSLPSVLSMVRAYLVARRDDSLSSIIQQAAQQNEHISSVQYAFAQGCRIIELLQSLPISIPQKQNAQLKSLRAFFEQYKHYCSKLVDQSANLSYYVQVKNAVKMNDQELRQMLDLVEAFENIIVRGRSLFSDFKEAVGNSENHPTINYYSVLKQMRSFVDEATNTDLKGRVANVTNDLNTMFEIVEQNASYQISLITDALEATSQVSMGASVK